jgi:hypothetical protein
MTAGDTAAINATASMATIFAFMRFHDVLSPWEYESRFLNAVQEVVVRRRFDLFRHSTDGIVNLPVSRDMTTCLKNDSRGSLNSRFFFAPAPPQPEWGHAYEPKLFFLVDVGLLEDSAF